MILITQTVPSQDIKQYVQYVQNNNWQNDVDTRRPGCGEEFMPQPNRRYEVPTQNRFSGLADNYQGNY